MLWCFGGLPRRDVQAVVQGVPDEEEIERPGEDVNFYEEADVYLMAKGTLANGDELKRRITLHYKARPREEVKMISLELADPAKA